MLFLVFFLRNRLKVIINSVDIQDKNLQLLSVYLCTIPSIIIKPIYPCIT